MHPDISAKVSPGKGKREAAGQIILGKQGQGEEKARRIV